MKFNAAFWKWFDKSKVVDWEGNPLVVYHGTGRKFSRFIPAHEALATLLTEMRITDQAPWEEVRQLKLAGEFYFFSEDYSAAESYSMPGGGVVKCYLRIQHPPKKLFQDNFSALDYLRGHPDVDGVAYHDTMAGGSPGGPGWIARKPGQIKAVNNDGTWDIDDPDIRSNPGITFNELPDDMQVLIGDIASDFAPDKSTADKNWKILDHASFSILTIPVSALPRVKIGVADGDERDEEYAMSMADITIPPIVLYKDYWLDGKHRVFMARESGWSDVPAIDLHEVGIQIDPKIFALGKVRR